MPALSPAIVCSELLRKSEAGRTGPKITHCFHNPIKLLFIAVPEEVPVLFYLLDHLLDHLLDFLELMDIFILLDLSDDRGLHNKFLNT